MRDLIKDHVKIAIGKCLDIYPVIQCQGAGSQQTIPAEKADLPGTSHHGDNGQYPNFPTPDRLFDRNHLTSWSPQLISSPCSTYVTGSDTTTLPEAFLPGVFDSDPSIPCCMPRFPLEGCSLQLKEEHPPLVTPSMEIGLILTGDVSQIPCGWSTFSQ